jgi:PBSX family phage terminase large subunit
MLSLHDSQKIVALDKHRFRVLCCGRRWGKTTLAIDQMKGQAAIPNARIAYVAPTYQQARDIAWEQLRKDCKEVAESINEARLEIKLVNGSMIVLRGWESIETLRGQNFNLVVLDEVASMRNFWVNWREVIRPTLTDSRGEAIFISTPKGFNHFYDLANQELTDTDFKTFHFTSYANHHLPVDELNSAKASLPPDAFSQEYLADFTKTQGLVYKEFDRTKHLYEELPQLIYWDKPMFAYQTLGAVDFGYRNPAAILTAKWNGERLFIEDEWYKRERTDIQIAEYVALQHFKEVYPDPENQGAIEELRRKNINVKEVVKGPGSVKNGIQMIREMLIRGDLLINKRCVNLIAEFEMYSYDDENIERNEQENPIKAHDHALDALRYLVSSLLPIVQRRDFMANMPHLVDMRSRKNPAR